MSYVQLQDAQFSSDGSLRVTLNLPVGKADSAGKGAHRSHKCACGMPGWRSVCPYHVTEAPFTFAKRAAQARGGDWRSAPLFPTASGAAFTKKA